MADHGSDSSDFDDPGGAAKVSWRTTIRKWLAWPGAAVLVVGVVAFALAHLTHIEGLDIVGYVGLVIGFMLIRLGGGLIGR